MDVPGRVGEHDQSVAVVVNPVEVDTLACFDVIVASFVLAEERRALAFVAALGVGRRERESLGESNTGDRALVEVNEPSRDVANPGRRVVVDRPSDVRVDPLVVDLRHSRQNDVDTSEEMNSRQLKLKNT